MGFLEAGMVAVLSAFLAVSNAAAGLLTDTFELSTYPDNSVVMSANDPVEAETSTDPASEPEDKLTSLRSRYSSTDTIPNILIENAAYQKASVIGSTSARASGTEATTNAVAALTNIYCTYQLDDTIYTRSGSGFFIDDHGVILTNAHVAQFLLLDDLPGGGTSDCVVRVGTPATEAYTVDLLYISPAWITSHAELIDSTEPSGTGERDYALLFVRGSVDSEPLPGRFPYLPLDESLLERSASGATVTISGYPAEVALTENGATAALRPRRSTTSITGLFTFDSDHADVMSLAGSSVGERGASGGPVQWVDGRVIGLLTTRGDDAADGAGSLRAITLAHIDRTILAESGNPLRAHLDGDIAQRATIFTDTIGAYLSDALETELLD